MKVGAVEILSFCTYQIRSHPLQCDIISQLTPDSPNLALKPTNIHDFLDAALGADGELVIIHLITMVL